MGSRERQPRERDPEPEMVPYRSDPGDPDTDRPSEFSADAWPPPNTGPVGDPDPESQSRD